MDGEVRPQRLSDLLQHAQRVTFVVGVLESRDGGLPGADQPRELRLREASTRPERVDLMRNLRVYSLLRDHRPQFGVVADEAIEEFHGVGRPLAGHLFSVAQSANVCVAGSASNFRLWRIAWSIAVSGTLSSFVIRWLSTAARRELLEPQDPAQALRVLFPLSSTQQILERVESGRGAIVIPVEDDLRPGQRFLDDSRGLALALEWPDFEDALQAACALHAGADAIATRNVRGYRELPLDVLTPAELLARRSSAN